MRLIPCIPCNVYVAVQKSDRVHQIPCHHKWQKLCLWQGESPHLVFSPEYCLQEFLSGCVHHEGRATCRLPEVKLRANPFSVPLHEKNWNTPSFDSDLTASGQYANKVQ